MVLAGSGDRQLSRPQAYRGLKMFTRSSPAERRPLEAVSSSANSSAARNTPPQPPRQRAATEAGPKSVIGNDLKIIGQGLKIISQGTLQVDGEIEGDVGGAE